MKNITRYFMDPIKPSDNTSAQSNGDKKKENKSSKHFKQKYNCKALEISEINSEIHKNTCDMIESSSDIIDKNSDPCKKISRYRSSKQTFSSKLPSPTEYKELQNQHLDYLSSKTNDVLHINNKKRISKSSLNASSDKKQYVTKSKIKENESSNIHLNDTCRNKKRTNSMGLLNINFNDEIKDNHEESNAFKILMGRNNSDQCITPTKFSTRNELHTKKSEEHRENLISPTEKLINDKKKCFKRKISDLESEKTEKVQKPMKLFKKEEKKDNFIDTTVLCQKQPSGNLLDYFSKTPPSLTQRNATDISTIIVKADVHMPQNTIEHNLYNSVRSNAIKPSKKNKTSDLQFSQIDEISVIESKSINVSNNEKEQKDQQANRRRWSLRIKFQTYKDEHTLLDSSDDELYSPRSKAKLNTESFVKSGIDKGTNSKNLQTKDKNNKEISKKMIQHTNSKLRKWEQSENSECNVSIQNTAHQKVKFENTHQISKCDEHKLTLVQNEDLNNCNDSDVQIIEENEFNQEDCIVINETNSKKKTTDKLAPIFTKQRKLNTKVTRAKQLFLQADIKDNHDKNINQQTSVCSVLPFPLISHITQSTDSVSNEINNFNYPQKVCNKLYVPDLNVKHYKHIVDFSKTKLKTSKSISKPRVEDVLTEIGKHCSDVKAMWDVISFTVKNKSNKIVSPNKRITKSKRLEKTGITEYDENQIANVSWTYKYRPKSTREIVGNEKAAIKLREWLVGWKKTFGNEDGNSGDEFYSSDSSYSKIGENNQVAVLLGPHGSGKTASVYAVAEEFGYTVLELNASSKRTGKKLLKELEEATKSYQIKKEKRISAFCDLTSDEIISRKISKKSLILVEDVDIIFEEDEGFISAMCQLASNTKCPIVMTCKDVCSYLNKLAPQQSRIYFQSAVGNKVSALLELISLAETGYRLPPNYITELLQSGDLRKAILQLQYLLLSGPPQMSEQFINFKNLFWQNMQYHLYRSAIIVSKKQKSKKTTSSKLISNDTNLLNDITNKLDNIALLSSLMNTEDSKLNLHQLKTHPSLSVVENTALYSMCNNVCLEIAEWIGNKIMYKDHDYSGIQYQNNIALRSQLSKEVNLTLSHTTSLSLDHQITAIDYFPTIRAICRAEEYRANKNNKRGNRYFHYLHNLKPPSLLRPNVLTAACKIMYDKIDSDTCTNKKC